MLSTIKSRFVDTVNYPLYSLSSPIEEGMGLAWTQSGGIGQAWVNPSATTGQFIGFAYSYFTTPVTACFVETFTVPTTSPYTVTLTNTPLNGNSGGLLVKDSTGTVYAYNASLSAGKFQSSANVVTFYSGNAGAVVTFTYRYNLTVAQAQYLVGDGVAGHTAPSDVTGTIGLVRRGIIYTSFFNPGVDYSTNPALYLGANGIIDPTNSSTGSLLSDAYVVEIPTSDLAMLGIWFSV